MRTVRSGVIIYTYAHYLYVSESIAQAESFTKAMSRTLAGEILSLVENVARMAIRSFAELVTIAERHSNIVSKSSADQIPSSDIATRQMSRSLPTDSLTPLDSVTRSASRAVVEAIAPLDSRSSLASKFPADQVAPVDITTRGMSRTLAETVNVFDSLARAVSRTVAGLLVLLDTRTPFVQVARADAVSPADSFSISSLRLFSFADLFGLFDMRSALVQPVRADGLAVADFRSQIPIKVFADPFSISETRSAAPSVQKADRFQVADSAVKQLCRSLTELVPVADLLRVLQNRLLSLLDSLSLLDFANQNPIKNFLDPVGISESRSQMVMRNAADSTAVSDNATRQMSRSSVENLTLSDRSMEGLARLFAFLDSVLPTDSGIRQADLRLVEWFPIGDAHGQDISRITSDLVEIAEASSNFLTRSLSELVAVADFANVIKARWFAFADAVIPADSLARSTARSLAEATLSFFEATSQALSKWVVDLVDPADVRSASFDPFPWTELLAPADNATRQMSRSAAEAISPSDPQPIAKMAGKSAADELPPADQVTKRMFRFGTDQVLLTELVAIIQSRLLFFADALLPADLVARVWNATLALSERVTVLESAARSIARSLAEALLLADSVEILQARWYAFLDAVFLGDATSRQAEPGRVDTVTPTDSAARRMSRMGNDNLSFGDLLAIAQARVSTLVDVLFPGETIARRTGRLVTDSLSIGDGVRRRLARSLTDIGQAIDALAVGLGRAVRLADAVLFADLGMRRIGRYLGDLVAPSESRTQALGRSVDDQVSPADAPAKFLARNVWDAMTLADLRSVARGYWRLLLDAFVPIDQGARAIGKSALDQVASADIATRRMSRALRDLVTVVESIRVQALRVRAFAEALPMADIAARVIAATRLDGVAIRDQISRVIATLRSDVTSVADAITKYLPGLAQVNVITVAPEQRAWSFAAAARAFASGAANRKWSINASARNWSVEIAARIIPLTTNEAEVITTIKDPSSTEDFVLDWTAEIGPSDSIQASNWTIPSGLTQINAKLTDKTTTVRLAGGGAAGRTYNVQNLVTLMSGQIKSRTIHIAIEVQ